MAEVRASAAERLIPISELRQHTDTEEKADGLDALRKRQQAIDCAAGESNLHLVVAEARQRQARRASEAWAKAKSKP